MKKSLAKKRIVVAMSGGVDSSVAAALLVEQGYEVIGITMQLYDHGAMLENKKSCCAGRDISDARKVCDTLGISHYVVNYESIFKDEVIDAFAKSYLRGETPNPCVLCNQTVKFRDLLKAAQDLGAEALATGHYVRRTGDKNNPELHRAIDEDKDQSYFLFSITRKQLSNLLFPLGNLTKNETRELAKKFALKVADKSESQDICFVPDGSYGDIVRKLYPEAASSGEILLTDGTIIGQHTGTINYTIGQRKGLGIAYHAPLYVVAINPELKQVIVGEEDALFSREFTIRQLNWLKSDKTPDEKFTASVQLRSTQIAVAASIYPNADDTAKVILAKPERAITPGQACVIYDGTRVLGGGWIT